jgi:hypothetical protein
LRKRAGAAEGNLSSPVDDGASSTRAEPDSAAQDQRGEDGNGRPGLEANSAQIPAIEAAAAETLKARRFAMLQRFMRAALLTLPPVFPFRRGKGKSKGKATTGGRAFQLRKMRNRVAKREAFFRSLFRKKHGRAQAPRSVGAKIEPPKLQP